MRRTYANQPLRVARSEPLFIKPRDEGLVFANNSLYAGMRDIHLHVQPHACLKVLIFTTDCNTFSNSVNFDGTGM